MPAGTPQSFTSKVFASGANIVHSTPHGKEAISLPDDITLLRGKIYVAFQNGVGPQGQSSTTGNLDSTVVEFNDRGREVMQWDLVGKCDGLTADRRANRVIATINEDAHSSAYLIAPGGAAVHYHYNEPLPSKGGTDAISIYHGSVLISASAPGTTGAAPPQASYPALYRVTFGGHTGIATIHPLYSDEAQATVANTPSSHQGNVQLALTDPDSNSVVPGFAPRFGGTFMLTSQGDQQDIFARGLPGSKPVLSVLSLTTATDDTAWPYASGGALYATDGSADAIYKVTGPITRGAPIVAATPCDSNKAPSMCPGPGYPPNYLAQLNLDTGAITAITVSGPTVEPIGLLYVR